MCKLLIAYHTNQNLMFNFPKIKHYVENAENSPCLFCAN